MFHPAPGNEPGSSALPVLHIKLDDSNVNNKYSSRSSRRESDKQQFRKEPEV